MIFNVKQIALIHNVNKRRIKNAITSSSWENMPEEEKQKLIMLYKRVEFTQADLPKIKEVMTKAVNNIFEKNIKNFYFK